MAEEPGTKDPAGPPEDASDPTMSTDAWRTYVCRHVTEGKQPVLTVCYHGGDAQRDAHLVALCGGQDVEHPPGSVVVMAWGCLREMDASLGEIDEDLAPDHWYRRVARGAAKYID